MVKNFTKHKKKINNNRLSERKAFCCRTFPGRDSNPD